MSEFQIDKYKFSSAPALSLIGDDVIEARAREAILLSKDLNKKGIVIKDLIIKTPSLKIRNKLLNIAKFILEDVELFDEFNQSDKLPIDKMVKQISVNRNLIEQWQDYIVTYIYILSNPEYKHINDYLRVEENIDLIDLKNNEEKSNEEVSYVLADTNSGIAVARSSKSAIILTSQGEFKRVSLGEKCKLGEEVSGKEKKSWKKHKFDLIIISVLFLSLIVTGVYKYVSPSSTLIIDTTSQMTIEVNAFERIISIKSPTEKGKQLIEDISILDTNIDEGLVELFTYVNKNGMVPEKYIIITVVGDPITYKTIEKTETYLKENDIDYKINNKGFEAGTNR